MAQVDVSTNKIVFRSGVVRAFDGMSCIDLEGGHTFRHPIKSVDCINGKYDILYEGIVEKVTYTKNNFTQEVFMLNTETWVFFFC